MNTVVVFSENVLVLSLDFDESVLLSVLHEKQFRNSPFVKGMTLPKWVLQRDKKKSIKWMKWRELPKRG